VGWARTRWRTTASIDSSYILLTTSSVLPERSHCLRKYSYTESARAPSVTSDDANSPVSGEMRVG